MIVNKNDAKEIRNGQIIGKNIKALSDTLDKLPGLFWYVELADIHFTNDLLNEVIPERIQNLIRAHKLNLLVVNHLEGLHIIVEYIYKKLVLEYDFPTSQLHFFSESYNILEAVQRASDYHNLPQIKTYYLRATEHYVATQEKVVSNFLEKKIKKKFLNLNRRWRPHRPTMVGLLHAKGLLEQGYVSLPKQLEGQSYSNTFDLCLYLNRQNQYISDLLSDNRDEIVELQELTLDSNDFENNLPMAKHTGLLAKYYNETIFSLVNETFFYKEFTGEKSIFITEKTYKAIAYKHPFLLVSTEHTLRALRTLGYKTFSPFIREDYDEIENDADRIAAILDEVERLCNLSEHKVNEFLNGCQEICEHNYKVLMTRTNLEECILTLN